MRIVIQRVRRASVTKSDTGEVTGKIGLGLFVLLGVKKGDGQKEADILVEKLFKLRVMSDEHGKMNLSVKDVGGEFLVVSQFTLYADTSAGNRPSFIGAALPDDALNLYEYFLGKLREKEVKVETGSFGDYMDIDCVLDGPVTIVMES